MYGVIHCWRVRPESRAEHERLMQEILRVERTHCPEVLLNLLFGPAEDGACAEIQIYPSAAAESGFAARVRREVEELQRLWDHHGTLCEPDAYRSFRFEGMGLLGESFVRREVTLGVNEGAPGGRLAGKVALVTGARRGNGLGIALAMASEGADVALVDLSADELRPGARQVEALGRRALVLEADVTDEAAVERCVAATVAGLGVLDILVNNAGVFPFKPIEAFEATEFSRVLDVNLKGPWLLCKYALPHLKSRPGAAIVNITSASGHYGGASAGGSAYDASKGGLRQLTYSLATEFGPYGIRVNAIAPGVVMTEAQGGEALAETEWGKKEIQRTPLRRLGRAQDVGAVAAFLASSDASYVNGVTIILDGGAMAAW